MAEETNFFTGEPTGYGEEGTPTKSDIAVMKKQARDNPDNQNPERSNTNMGPTSSSSTTRSTTNPQRLILGMLGVTVVFALGSNVLSGKATTGNQGSGINAISSNGKIILGGFFAGGVLVLISEAGEAGAQFATGLALIAMVTTLLVKGGPVWSKASSIFGSQPTNPLSTATTPAVPTQPTHGAVNTAAALEQVAA